MRFLTLAGALWLVLAAVRPEPAVAESEPAAAAPEPAAEAALGTELTVSGPPGAFLRVDDKPVGRLPLEAPFALAAGPHRFQLERQGHRYESDVLPIPQGRVAELSLTPGNQGTAIAVLSLTPMVLLAVRGGSLDDKQQQALRAAVQEGARAEHSVLVPPETLAAVTHTQAPDCLSRAECQVGFAAAAEARQVLRLELPASRPPTPADLSAPCLRGELLDVKTGQSALRGEQACGGSEESLPEAALQLTRRLISGAAKLGRGIVMVTSEPAAAQVLIDGQPRGVTPWEGPSLPGLREVLVNKPEYEPQRTQVTVAAEQTVSVQLALNPIEREPAPASLPPAPPKSEPAGRLKRPLWRLVSGGVALAAGVALVGLGAAGVAQDGACADQPPPVIGNCSYLYSTAGLGGGGLTVGLALAGAGIALIAIPGPRTGNKSDGVPR